jgi:UDPglucose--hexose-1-phosphate uridylyltransferase
LAEKPKTYKLKANLMSEFRRNPGSGEWVIVVPERSKRPHELVQKNKPRNPTPKKTCPFENLKESDNWPPILSYPDDKNWEIVLVQNKYPYLSHDEMCAVEKKIGIYDIASGVGSSDLIITRDHDKNIADLPINKAVRIFEFIQKRFQALSKDKCLIYGLPFFNWGKSAGASVYHPHYQLLTLPIIPPTLSHSFAASERYFKLHRSCLQCSMVRYEKKHRKRVIVENKDCIAIVPFASGTPYQVRIIPKKHLPHVQTTVAPILKGVVEILQKSLKSIKTNLNDPDLNFFIHTAPIKSPKKYHHYHWHIEVIPKITNLAGFELGTGMEVNVVDPEKATELLRVNSKAKK